MAELGEHGEQAADVEATRAVATFEPVSAGAGRSPLTSAETDQERRVVAVRVAAAFMFVGCGISLCIVPIAAAANAPGFDVTGVLVPALSGFLSAPVLWTAARQVSWIAMTSIAVVVSLAITVGQHAAGPHQPYGAVLYLWIATWAYLFLPRRTAIAMTVLVGIEYAVSLALTDGAAGPASRWIYVMSTAVMTAVVVDRLVRRGEQLAAARQVALTALEEAQGELADLNQNLTRRVEEQVAQIEALGSLRRFLSPQVTDAVLRSTGAQGNDLLAPHRREIAVWFCDLRGFTRFAATSEPEDVMTVLSEYFAALGQLITRFDATVGSFTGDGMMAYFNDPLPCDRPAERAIELALAARDLVQELSRSWAQSGHRLGFGVGIAYGFATLGMSGFEGRRDYGPVGTVVNLASRLCDHAEPGEVLIDNRARSAAASEFDTALVGALNLKGFSEAVPAFRVVRRASGP